MITCILQAQNNKELYNTAFNYYNDGEYEKSINMLDLLTTKLKFTNPKIEGLLFQAYFYNEDYKSAKIAYEKLLKLTPNSIKQGDDFKPFLELGEQIEDALEEEEEKFVKNREKRKTEIEKERMAEAESKEVIFRGNNSTKKIKLRKQQKDSDFFYKKAVALGDKDALKEFTKSFPNDYKVSEAKSKIEEIKKEEFRIANEDNVWNRSKDADTYRAYKNYLKIYYDGKYREEARQRINELDRLAYEKAVDLDTQNEYLFYLNIFEDGKFRGQVQTKLAIRKEKDLFNRAKGTSSINIYEDYARTYPSGMFIDEAETFIGEYYYNKGIVNYKDKNYYEAKSALRTYERKFPYGSYSKDVSRKLKRIDARLSRSSMRYMMASYNSYNFYGFEFGGLNLRKVGTYLSWRLNTELFNVIGTVDEVDRSSINTESDQYEFGIISGSFGLTKSIIYPLHIHVGGGVMYQKYYMEGEEEDSYVLLNIESEDEVIPFPEAALSIKLGSLAIKAGASYIKEEIYYQGGIGFKL